VRTRDKAHAAGLHGHAGVSPLWYIQSLKPKPERGECAELAASSNALFRDVSSVCGSVPRWRFPGGWYPARSGADHPEFVRYERIWSTGGSGSFTSDGIRPASFPCRWTFPT